MLTLSRRILLTGGVLCLSLPAYAQSWPQKPVTIVVPQAAGNSPDVLCTHRHRKTLPRARTTVHR